MSHGEQQVCERLEELVRWAADLDVDAVGDEGLERAQLVVIDTIGVMIAGARQAEIAALAHQSGRVAGPARMCSPGVRWACVQEAALVNGMAVIALELDEHLPGGGHPAAHVVPAALAAAQAHHRSGTELLTAVIAGYEVAARLFAAWRMQYPAHPHGHLGAVGAALAVARLSDDCDPLEAARIACSMPLLTTWAPCHEGATSRGLYTGMSAVHAVTAAQVASAGARGTFSALPEAMSISGRFSGEGALRVNGALAVHRGVFTRYSAAGPLHPAIHAARALAPVDTGRIAAITVDVGQQVRKFGHPAVNDLSSRFSLSYAVAAALLGLHDSPLTGGFDPQVALLATRVETRFAEDASPQARVQVREAGGKERTAQAAAGDETAGRADEVYAKFRAVAGPYAPKHLSRLRGLRDTPDCRGLLTGDV